MRLFGIIGKPVIHSKSPQMHNAAFRSLGLDACYIRLAAESREEGLEIASGMGICGLNVTSPFKDIIDLVDSVDPSAEKIGAVNTVLLSGGLSRGYNTDAHGVAEALKANGIRIKGENALVLGSGGASKAAAVALVENGATVTIANRTEEKARMLGETLGAGHCSLSKDSLLKAVSGVRIIIGCISTAERVIPKELLESDMAIMDAHYLTESALDKDGKAAGCKVIDGREWLLHQGAKSFELFTDRKAPIEDMRKAVYSDTRGTKRNIALIGFMGSGKTSVAGKLSQRMKMSLMNVDAEVEKQADASIAEIFEKKGEAHFRALEGRQIMRLAGAGGIIADCGGGAVGRMENRRVLGENAIVIWLWAKHATVLSRLGEDRSRPLLKGHQGLFDQRMPGYAEASDMVVSTDGKTPEQVAERIAYETNKALQDIG